MEIIGGHQLFWYGLHTPDNKKIYAVDTGDGGSNKPTLAYDETAGLWYKTTFDFNLQKTVTVGRGFPSIDQALNAKLETKKEIERKPASPKKISLK